MKIILIYFNFNYIFHLIMEPDTSSSDKKFYYKVVAKLNDKFLSIYDGKTEYTIGETMH